MLMPHFVLAIYHMKVPASYLLDDFNSFFQMVETIF